MRTVKEIVRMMVGKIRLMEREDGVSRWKTDERKEGEAEKRVRMER